MKGDIRDIEWRLSQLENAYSNNSFKSSMMSGIEGMKRSMHEFERSEVSKKDLLEVKREMMEIKPSSNSWVIKFHDLKIYSLKDMIE